jgi:glucose/arabinose dehydrogenase
MLSGVLIAAGCADDPTPEETATTTTAANGSSAPDGQVSSLDLSTTIRLQELDLGLDSVIAASAVPGSRSMIVAERSGRLHEVVIDGTGATLADGPLLDLSDRVGSTSGERGFLGVAVAPDRSALVASYTGPGDDSRIDRFDLSGSPGRLRADERSATSLLTIEQPFANHNGGHVTFGPDGMLYIGLGDGGSGGDPEGNGQDRRTLLGSILRIDALGEPLVPPDNPFADGQDDARPEIWLTGVRNPWRFSFDPGNGDLWVADVGQNRQEEVNRLGADNGAGRGANLGWNLFEGDERFGDPRPAPGDWSDGPFVEPVHTYGHDRGCSVTGGVVYRGGRIPGLSGAYLFADFCADDIRAFPATAGRGVESVSLSGATLENIVAFTEDPDGEVLVISLSAGVWRIEPA